MTKSKIVEDLQDSRDPITGAPDSHPVETGIGAATMGTLGALAGGLAGPLGAVAGAAIGASAGGMLGHKLGEQYEEEGAYGRVSPELQRDFDTRAYAIGGTYTDFEPAYQYGAAAFHAKDGRNRMWDASIEQDLRNEWSATEHAKTMSFDHARDAVRDAWLAAERASRRQE